MSNSAISGIIASSQFFIQSQEEHPGLTYLKAEARVFYDFTKLEGTSGDITSNDTGLLDIGPGGYDASPEGSIDVQTNTYSGNVIKTIVDVGGAYIDTGHDGTGWFDSSFEVFVLFNLTDGIGENIDLMGVTDFTTTDRFNLFITSTGLIRFQYRTGSTTFIRQSTSPVFMEGDNGLVLLRLKYDFEGNTFEMWKDGVAIPLTNTSGNVSDANPTNWSQSRNIFIGSNNSGGTPSTNTTTNYIARVAITDILNSTQAEDVIGYLSSFNPPPVKPNVQATELIADARETSVNLSWQRGNGSHCLVIAKLGTEVTAIPVDTVSYTANTVFGSGSEIGTDNFVVFAGIGNQVTVTGIPSDTKIAFAVFEYNAQGLSYLTSISSNHTATRTYVIYDENFSNYATDYTEEGSDYTTTIANGELIIDGEPLGYLANIVHNEGPGALLEEFEVEIKFRINDAPGTGTPGLGIGIKNNLTSEANRGVMAVFNTDTDSGSFSTISIYRGTGAVNASGYTFASYSGTSIFSNPPADQSEYILRLRRVINGNDATYTATIIDILNGDESIVATWTEPGRPSSAFFATTTRFFIYQNGGEHAIDYFAVRRVGDQVTEPEPEPEPEDFDIYVTISGNDLTGDGSIGNPLRTNVAGLAAIAALGGSNRRLHTGPGEYTEGSFLNPPANLGHWEGAGKGLTVIKGSPSLHTPITQSGRSGTSRYLVSLINKGNVNMTIKGITFDGNRNIGGETNSMRGGIVIANTHGVTLDGIEVRYFNTSGIKLENVNSWTLKGGWIMRDTGGVQGTSFVYYSLPWVNVGGPSILTEGNPTILVEDGEMIITDPEFGSGMGFVGGAGSAQTGVARWQRNVEIRNVFFNFSSTTNDNDGHRFNIEWNDCDPANIWVHDCYFRSNLSFGQIGRQFVSGKTRYSNNRIALENSPSLTFEMQISNIEIDHNYVTGVRNGCWSSSNHPINPNNGSVWHSGEDSRFRSPHGDWHIHHNIVETRATQGNSFTVGYVGAINWPLENILVENDTIIYNTTLGFPMHGIYVPNTGNGGVPGSPYTSSNIVIQNCAFYGQPPAGSNIFNSASGGILIGGIARNNKSTHMNVLFTRTGLTGGAGQNNAILGGNLGLKLTGAKPDPFYRPNIGSPLDGTGFGGTYVGALAPA